jgi:hypothetical protein
MTLLPARSAPNWSADWRRTATAQSDGGTIVHVAGGRDDALRLAAAAAAISESGVFEQLAIDAAPEPCVAATLAELDASVRVYRLVADRDDRLVAFEAELAAARCVALVLHADDDASLVAAMAAARIGIAVVRVGGAASPGPGRVIARLAELLLVFGDDDARTLSGRGAPERIRVVGNPLVDIVRRCAPQAVERAAWRDFGLQPRGYVLAVLTGGPDPQAAMALGNLAARVPLLVEAADGWSGIELPSEARRVRSTGVVERLSLERAAGAIITNSRRVQEEAAAVGVRCHAFGAVAGWPGAGAIVTAADPSDLAAVRPAPHEPTPCAIPYWDGNAGARVATVLVANFARLSLG